MSKQIIFSQNFPNARIFGQHITFRKHICDVEEYIILRSNPTWLGNLFYQNFAVMCQIVNTLFNAFVILKYWLIQPIDCSKQMFLVIRSSWQHRAISPMGRSGQWEHEQPLCCSWSLTSFEPVTLFELSCVLVVGFSATGSSLQQQGIFKI